MAKTNSKNSSAAKQPKDNLGRYGKVYYRIWGDAVFRKLSRPQPCAQSLLLHLLTSPKRSPIPGVLLVTEYELALANQWSVEELRGPSGQRLGGPLGELSRHGLVTVDFTVGIVFLTHGFRYNKPENHNVVTGWRIAWEEIPECSLKNHIWQSLREGVEQLGGLYAQQFHQWIRQPSDNGYPNGKGGGWGNQEQELEQEQEPIYSEPIGSGTDVPQPPKKEPRKTTPEPPAEIDPVKALWDRGVAALGGTGRGESSVRGILGKARRDFGDVAVLEAISATETEQPSDPIPWFLAACKSRQAAAKPHHETADEILERHFRAAGYEEPVAVVSNGSAGHPQPARSRRRPPQAEPGVALGAGPED